MNILLVEDDPGIGRFVSRGLAAEGYDVEWQRAGEGVADRLGTAIFSAAIFDLGLPDMDGVDLCRTLRRDGIDTPVLMLTARAALEDRLDGLRSGADDYLAKPFSFEELVLRLKALVRRTAERDRSLIVGAMRIDMLARVVTIAGSPASLSPREFDLLACLSMQKDGVVSRTHLLDGVWGADADVSPNALDVCIGGLRRKLGTFARAPAVETVHGRGFRLSSR